MNKTYTEDGTELQARKTVPELFQLKLDIMASYKRMEKEDAALDSMLHAINSYSFARIDRNRIDVTGEDWLEKTVDQKCWNYMIKLFNLEKYMLCTEYAKLRQQIDSYQFPVFDPDNANAWLTGLKKTVYENVQRLIEDVFTRITDGTYKTGSSWNTEVQKKRNNNGIDPFFILRTYDSSALAYWRNDPTITDDLEKACYIIDGKTVPEVTIKNLMQRGKIWESENEYFRIRVCKNGNTHYWLKDTIRAKLNLYGSRKGVFGENIKIKIFERE